MMAYLRSENIKIFPFGSHRNMDPNGRLLNESNLVRLIKSFVDSDSYVISYDENTDDCVFVVGGYYCECNLKEFIEADKPLLPLYVSIQLTVNDDQPVLSGNDNYNDGTFTGVEFSTEPTDFSACLQILNSEGKVPVESYKKFNYTSVQNNYTTIDCGSATTVL